MKAEQNQLVNTPHWIDTGALALHDEGERGLAWHWDRCVTAVQKEQMDHWLIEIKHPLAYQPGTREFRYRTVCKERLEQRGAEFLRPPKR